MSGPVTTKLHVWLGVVLLLAGCAGARPVVVNRTSGPGHGTVNDTAPVGGPGQAPLLSGGTGPVAGPLTQTNVR